MASMLASKHRSSSFSFLPKKTMIATHSASCPLPDRKTLSGQSSRLRRNFTANLFTLSHSHYYSFTFSIIFLPRNIVVIWGLKYHFISFNAEDKFEIWNLRLTRLALSPWIVNHYLIICALITPLIHRFNTAQPRKIVVASLAATSQWMETLSYTCRGLEGPWSRRGDRKWHPVEVVGRLRSACWHDFEVRYNSCYSPRSEFLNDVCADISHAKKSRGKNEKPRRRKRRERERDERKKSEDHLDRGNLSATGCRLASQIRSWPLRRVGDVHAARNKPAGGCWTNGGGRAKRERREEK